MVAVAVHLVAKAVWFPLASLGAAVFSAAHRSGEPSLSPIGSRTLGLSY